MRRIQLFASSTALFLLPFLVSAQERGLDSDGELQGFMDSILDFGNTVIIPFLIGIGFLVFVWGMFQYFIVGGANDEAKDKGKQLIIYAISGFLLIFVFWGIINVLVAGTGLNEEFDTTLPVAPGIGE